MSFHICLYVYGCLRKDRKNTERSSYPWGRGSGTWDLGDKIGREILSPYTFYFSVFKKFWNYINSSQMFSMHIF